MIELLDRIRYVDRMQAVGDETVDYRVGGLKDDVELKAVGLPTGVSMTVLPPAKKDDDVNKMTLRLTAEKAGVAGAFQIVGTTRANAARTRLARVVNPQAEPTTHLWLTVSSATPK